MAKGKYWAIIKKTAGQTLTTGIQTEVTSWITPPADRNPAGMFAAANSNRITILVSGLYQVFLNISFVSNGTGSRFISPIHRNSSGTPVGSAQVQLVPVSGAATSVALSPLTYMSAGDYMTIDVTQTSGGNLDICGAAPEATFGLARIGS